MLICLQKSNIKDLAKTAGFAAASAGLPRGGYLREEYDRVAQKRHSKKAGGRDFCRPVEMK